MVHDESHNVVCRDGESSWRAHDVRVVTASRDGVLVMASRGGKLVMAIRAINAFQRRELLMGYALVSSVYTS
jgi:hypothetical protein